MAAGNEVCTYVVNALCRKFFMDERPTVSKKHYFFSSVAVSVSINILLTHVYMFSFHVQLFLFSLFIIMDIFSLVGGLSE
jgi:hypothetical protein